MKKFVAAEMKRSDDPLLDALKNNTRYPDEWDKR
jgi:hypothetical protein